VHSELHLLKSHVICFHDDSLDLILLITDAKDLERTIYFALVQEELWFEGGVPLFRHNSAGSTAGNVLVHRFKEIQISQTVALNINKIAHDVVFQELQYRTLLIVVQSGCDQTNLSAFLRNKEVLQEFEHLIRELLANNDENVLYSLMFEVFQLVGKQWFAANWN